MGEGGRRLGEGSGFHADELEHGKLVRGIRAGEKFGEVALAVVVGIGQRVLRVEGIEAVGHFPVVQQAVAVGVRRR